MVRPLRGRVCFSMVFHGLTPTERRQANNPALKGRNNALFDPFRVEFDFGTLFRGLAPTAIHVYPLRGWRKAHVPRREQLELLQPAEKFGGEQ